MMNEIFQGSLFTHDFLSQSISDNPDWVQLTDSAIDALASELRGIFAKFPVGQTPNETRTEDDLIWPILRRLGWTQSMRQQNLTVKGREDVPDGLLFADAAAKAQADQHVEEYKRYQFGRVAVWCRSFDYVMCSKGDGAWAQAERMNFGRMRCGSR